MIFLVFGAGNKGVEHLPFAGLPRATRAGAFQRRRRRWRGLGAGRQVPFYAAVVGHVGESSNVGRQKIVERLPQFQVVLLLTEGERL